LNKLQEKVGFSLHDSPFPAQNGKNTMSYTRATKVNECLAAGYANLQKAFAKLDVWLDSPSIDGFLRCLTFRNGRRIYFSAYALPLNSAYAQSLAHDKLATCQLLDEQGFAVPKGIAFFKREFHDHETKAESDLLIENLPKAVSQYFPAIGDGKCKVIVKPGRESRCYQVKVCRTLAGIMEHAEEVLDTDHYGLIQEYVETPEYRVVVLDDEILCVYLKQPRKLDEEGKPKVKKHHQNTSGPKPVLVPPLDVAVEVRNIARNAHRALGLRYSGVDVCLPRGVPPAVVLEVNSNPGLDFLEICHPDEAQEVADRIARAVVKSVCAP
jgi:glutathione synthase/RimK-type ligase-like ATP-grasp enzyme